MEYPSNTAIAIGVIIFMFFAWIILTPAAQLTKTMGGMIGFAVGVAGLLVVAIYLMKRITEAGGF